ncbi:hypothetical protein PTSG_02977 [Salpingoeca rosetta]|uniref:Uncharacterized protein n=1 Tax=Salpingoeca rosetta (strain ATCC 50818 / BSB-021) TaxID=946362 RepID=F2U3W5_SALR5|nr:uncharacterized protein PTSG_02977 [Salpingoeca rosetta]EGD82309.1 hypothetical protein PTSG_02977 [Salpingoeca rosetta]|eukprot:XP_004996492.1 hypothetical protein PTSG_02977 [Salpingoeca rosetta]
MANTLRQHTRDRNSPASPQQQRQQHQQPSSSLSSSSQQRPAAYNPARSAFQVQDWQASVPQLPSPPSTSSGSSSSSSATARPVHDPTTAARRSATPIFVKSHPGKSTGNVALDIIKSMEAPPTEHTD